MALPKRIIKETERLMAEPCGKPSTLVRDGAADRDPKTEFPGLAPFPTTTISATLTSRSTALRPRRTRVRPTYSGSSVLRTRSGSLTQTAGGIFKLELFLPDDYPMAPPKIRFLTKIFHPNVDKLGRICLDVLKSGL